MTTTEAGASPPTTDLCTHEGEETVCRIAHGHLADAPARTIETICCGCGTVLDSEPPATEVAS